MQSDHNVCDELTTWPDKGDSSLTEVNMDEIIGGSTRDITNERRQKDERDDEISDAIVFFQLHTISALLSSLDMQLT
jgi:hypothetical protein